MQHQGNDFSCKLEQFLKGMAALYISSAFQNETFSVPFESLLHWISHDRTEKNQSILRVLQTHLLPGKPTILGACALVHISIIYVRARCWISALTEQSEILQHSEYHELYRKQTSLAKNHFFFSFNASARGWHYVTEQKYFLTARLKNNKSVFFIISHFLSTAFNILALRCKNYKITKFTKIKNYKISK